MNRMVTTSRISAGASAGARRIPAHSNDVFNFGPPEVRRRAARATDKPAVFHAAAASHNGRAAGKVWGADGVASPSHSPSPSPNVQPTAFTHAEAGRAQVPWAVHAVAAAQGRAQTVVGDMTRALGEMVKVLSQCMQGSLRRQDDEQEQGDDGGCEGAAAAANHGEEGLQGTNGARTSSRAPTSSAFPSPRVPAQASATTTAHGPGSSAGFGARAGGAAGGSRSPRRGSVRGSPDLMRRFVRRMTFKPHTTSSAPYLKWLRAVKGWARYNASRSVARARRQLAGVRQIKLRGSRGWFIAANDCAGRPAPRPSSPLTVIGGGGDEGDGFQGSYPDGPGDLSVDWLEGFDDVDDVDDVADGWLTEEDSAIGAGRGWCGDVKVDVNVDRPEPAVGRLPLDWEALPLEWDALPGDRGSAERRANAWQAYRNRAAEAGAWLSGPTVTAAACGGDGAYAHLPSDLFDEPQVVPYAEDGDYDDEMPPLIPCTDDEDGGDGDTGGDALYVRSMSTARFTRMDDAGVNGASSPATVHACSDLAGVFGHSDQRAEPAEPAGQTDGDARLADLCRQQVSLSAAFRAHWARFGYP